MAKKKVEKVKRKERPKRKFKTVRLDNNAGIPRVGIKKKLSKNFKTPFVEGNQFWNLRSKHGRDKLFTSPELMWQAACEYFQWCRDNPLYEEKVFHSDGRITRTQVAKIRAFTFQGLCRYLNCNTDYFKNFKNQQRKNLADFSPVIHEIEEAIYQQKFEAAATDLLNANIISRDLGLIDKKDIVTGGDKIEPPKINVYNTAPPLHDDEKDVK